MSNSENFIKENYILLLCIFIGITSFLLLIVPFVHTLENVPPISVTYDVFFNSVIANAVHDSGQFRTYPDYRAYGMTDAVIADPPLVFSIPAIVSMLSTVPTYPTFVIVLAFFQVFMCLGIFVLVRKYFNETTAIFTLVISAIPATSAWLFQYFIGFTSSLESFAFTSFVFFLLFLTLEKRSILSEVLIGGAFSVQMMLHGPAEVGYIGLFIGMIFAYLWLTTKSKTLIYTAITIGVTTVILSTYQYMLLRLARLTQEGLTAALLSHNPIPEYFPRPQIHWIFIIFGIIGIFIILQKVLTKKFSDKKIFICAFIVYVLAIVMSYIIGVDGSRSMRQLYNLYPFIALIPAIGIYSILQLIKSKISGTGLILITTVLVALIAITSFQPTYRDLNAISQGGFATESRWDTLEWIKSNTPKNSRVFYLYGFEHEFQTFAERIPYKGDMGLGFTQINMIQLCQGIYPESYLGDWGSSLLTRQKSPTAPYEYPYSTGFLSFEFKPLYTPGTNNLMITPRQNVTMDHFDYVIAQYKGTQADPCIAFFVNQSLERGHKVVWYNDQYVALEVNP